MTSDPFGGGSTAIGLRRFLNQRPPPRPGTTCDMCRADMADRHGHIVNIESRALMCTCRPCYLLFTNEGAGGGKYRIVGERVVTDPDFELSDAVWARLQIPVSMAFFFNNTSQERIVALYPSPGGATESTLPLDAWDEIVTGNPMLESLKDDVEAALFRKGDDGYGCFVVPIDLCYELVGRVKRSWRGFDGGGEMWAELDEFFDRVRERATH